MINVAILEDEKTSADMLEAVLWRYSEESGERFNIKRFENAVSFLTGYSPEYDIVFMDIQMPYMDGMKASEKLREIDTEVIIVFVTNLARYAVHGYKVGALDFIVKPVEYYGFKLTLIRCLEKIGLKSGEQFVIASKHKYISLNVNDILYVEIMGHRIIYHTKKSDIEGYGTLGEVEKRLKDKGFVRCNSCYLVNLDHVRSLNGYTLTVGGRELSVSHSRLKECVRALAERGGAGGE